MMPPREDQCECYRMNRKTRPDCAVMWNLIITHTERERVTPRTGSDCAVIIRRHFQHVHLIPIVGMGERGAY